MEVALQAWCVFHAHDSDCDILKKKRIVTVMTCSKIRECPDEPRILVRASPAEASKLRSPNLIYMSNSKK
jgi:hypothetical protein